MQANDKEIVFLDEIHELVPQIQTVLYRAMEDRTISLEGRDKRTLNLSTKDFTLIGATTDEFRLLSPLRDRFKVILPFVEYEADSLSTITIQRAQSLGIELDEGVGVEIARRSKGTPRLAIRLLESCHRYARSRGDDRITAQCFEATAILDGLDELGLGPDEQRYLQFLSERNGEPVRLFTIESALAIHRRTIQSVIEPFLVKSGLVERHSQGRTITETGLRHLGLVAESNVSTAQ